ADLDYFANGSDLLEKALNAIRGRVEIEQAERDRNLQTTIAVVGVGIGVAGVVSSSYTLAVDKPWAPPSFQHPLPLHPFFSAVIISCLCGGILGGLAWAIARKVLKSSPAQTRLTDSQNPPVNHILREAEEVRCLRQASLTNPPEQQ
ncbi:MAG: hypothetical protein EAZ78_16025, partial [Oscillatoriales cyanobacterium]